jgi:NDP-sugar pyrophosphorylase family protein
MDYTRMLVDHVEHGAACTVGCIEVPRSEAHAFGVMKVDDRNRILEFNEKPAEPDTIPGRPDTSLASMGIYLFDAELLYDELPRHMSGDTTQHDFGRDVIPALVRAGHAVAHPFGLSCVGTEPGKQPYWRDVGTLDAYWSANIDLTATDPALNLYDRGWPISDRRTSARSWYRRGTCWRTPPRGKRWSAGPPNSLPPPSFRRQSPRRSRCRSATRSVAPRAASAAPGTGVGPADRRRSATAPPHHG